jgi:hypothetical protein
VTEKHYTSDTTLEEVGSNIRFPISLSNDLTLPTRELYLLQWVQGTPRSTTFRLQRTRMNFDDFHGIGQVLRSRHTALASSEPFRYATLIYISHHLHARQQQPGVDKDTCDYIQRFYTATTNAIDHSATADVLRASAIMMFYALSSGQPVETMLVHLEGLFSAFACAKSDQSILSEDIALVQQLCLSLFNSLRLLLHQFQTLHPCLPCDVALSDAKDVWLEWVEIFLNGGSRRLADLLQWSFSLEPSLPALRTSSWILSDEITIRCKTLLSLGSVLSSFMCQYFRVEQSVHLSRKKQRTESALKEIIAIIYKITPPHLSTAAALLEFESSAQRLKECNYADILQTCGLEADEMPMFLTFAFTNLVERILFNPESLVSNSGSISSAYLVCQILLMISELDANWHYQERSLQVLPCLFWCGIVIKESVDQLCKMLSVFIANELAHAVIRNAITEWFGPVAVPIDDLMKFLVS